MLLDILVMGVDPGLNACGIATWDGQFFAARTVRPKSHNLTDRIYDVLHRGLLRSTCVVLVVERPQVYQQGPVDPNDLVALSVLVGAIVGFVQWERCLLPLPARWKGQTPKGIHHQRILRRVGDRLAGSKSKDALDAVGLCLYGIDHASTKT